MKKILVFLMLTIFSLCAYSNELEEDYFDIAANYCVTGDYRSAMAYIDKILEMNPTNRHVYGIKQNLIHIINEDKNTFITVTVPGVKEALEAEKIGEVKNEFVLLNNALKQSNSYYAYYYLGNYYRERQNYIKALDCYNSAITLKPDFAQAYLSAAIVELNIGEYSSAINSIDTYLKYTSQDDLAYAIKSRAEFATGKIDKAQIDNNKALQLNNCPEYRFDKAKILYMNGEIQQAKDLFVSLLPDIQTSKIYEYMGLCDYELKNYSSALLNIDKAILLSNNDEYLENKYNEIKNKLENKKNER